MIQAPGIYQMDAADYHADPCAAPSLSSSIAKILVGQSPRHAWHAHPRLNKAIIREEKEEYDIGSAAHALLLEGDDRMEQIAHDDYRTKAAKEARDNARAQGRYPVLERVYQDVIAMRDKAVLAIKDCADLSGVTLVDGDPEQTIVWREGDIWCRARTDWLLRHDKSLILDYKSTTDATPTVFTRHISKMDYHIQDAFYRRGVAAVTGKMPRMIFIAQEKKAPYGVSFHGVGSTLADIADVAVERAIQLWQQCIKTDLWPDYSPRIHYAEAANWQMQEFEEQMAEGNEFHPDKMWERKA